MPTRVKELVFFGLQHPKISGRVTTVEEALDKFFSKCTSCIPETMTKRCSWLALLRHWRRHLFQVALLSKTRSWKHQNGMAREICGITNACLNPLKVLFMLLLLYNNLGLPHTMSGHTFIA